MDEESEIDDVQTMFTSGKGDHTSREENNTTSCHILKCVGGGKIHDSGPSYFDQGKLIF